MMKIPNKSLLDNNNEIVSTSSTAADSSTALVETKREKTWVTCFGFPPGQSDVIVSYFQTVKSLTVVDVEPKNDRNANWIHIKFKSQKEVAVALGESGQVLELNGVRIMIGVVVFTEGDQLDAKSKVSLAAAAFPASVQEARPSSAGGPRKVSSLWEKAAVWVMDM